jgi:outer membrane protein OmpA-like peptidoglycan-associated protein
VIRRACLLLAVLAVAGCAAQKPAEPQQFVVYFQTGDASVTQEAQQVIAQAAAATRQHAPSKITVEGHADGGTSNDAALADRRAIAVMGALVRSGVNATAIEKTPGTPAAGATGVAAHQAIIRLMP